MLKLNFSASSFTLSEKFFVERSLELINKHTIDSHRVQLHNPKSILIELRVLLKKFRTGGITSFDYIKTLLEEAILFLERDSILSYEPLSKEYFLSTLRKTRENNFHQTFIAINSVVETNCNYLRGLEIALNEEIEKCNVKQLEGKDPPFERLERMTNSIVTEWSNAGYSKNHLNYLIFHRLYKRSEKPFKVLIGDIFEILNVEEKLYKVYFKTMFPDEFLELFSNFKRPNVHINVKEDLKKLSEKSRYFLKKESDAYKTILRIDVNATDNYAALKKGQEIYNQILDKFHLGYKDWNNPTFSKAFVVTDNGPNNGNAENLKYNIDGYTKNGIKVAEKLLFTLDKIRENTQIDPKIKNRINSCLRQLRIANNSISLEQKFLNYWIGFEGLFSQGKREPKGIDSLKDSFLNSNSLIYFRRKTENLHRSIILTGLENQYPEFSSEDCTSIVDQKRLSSFIQSIKEVSPLLATRAYEFLKLLQNKENLRISIARNREKTEWNIMRIYRIRNEIVHNAVNGMNLETIIGHLRYYSRFSLSRMIQYFSTEAFDINLDGTVGFEDFFLSERLKYNNLMETLKNSSSNLNYVDRALKIKMPETSVKI